MAVSTPPRDPGGIEKGWMDVGPFLSLSHLEGRMMELEEKALGRLEGRIIALEERAKENKM